MRTPEIVPPKRGHACPAEQALQAFAVGEALPEVEAHCPTCPACAAHVEAIQHASAEFRALRPGLAFVERLNQRRSASEKHAVRTQPRAEVEGASRREARGERGLPVSAYLSGIALRPLKRWSWLPISGAIAASVWFGLIANESSTIRHKGASFRVVYRRGEQAPLPVTLDMVLRAGDALRFAYARAGHVAILDRDSTGRVTAFFPFGGNRSHPWSAQSDFFPGSVALDTAVGPEWLISIWSPEPFDLQPWMEQLSAQPVGQAPVLRCNNCEIETLRIVKRP